MKLEIKLLEKELEAWEEEMEDFNREGKFENL